MPQDAPALGVEVLRDALAVVAHDLRSPLMAIVANASLIDTMLGEPGCDMAAIRRRLEVVRRAGKRMERLLDGLVDINRLERGVLSLNLGDESVSALLDQAGQEVTPGANARGVHLRIEGADGTARCDRDRIMQVFSNLTSNALRFVPSGGTITVGAVVAPREIRFFVRDTGCGLDADAAAHVFEPFWQADRTHRNGLGLGLTISRALVEAHGGRIRVESEHLCGATFEFTVPSCLEQR